MFVTEAQSQRAAFFFEPSGIGRCRCLQEDIF